MLSGNLTGKQSGTRRVAGASSPRLAIAVRPSVIGAERPEPNCWGILDFPSGFLIRPSRGWAQRQEQISGRYVTLHAFVLLDLSEALQTEKLCAERQQICLLHLRQEETSHLTLGAPSASRQKPTLHRPARYTFTRLLKSVNIVRR